MQKNRVVIGLLGPTLDRGQGSKRWERWRPNVNLFQHEEFLVDRFELLSQKKFSKLANQIAEDVRSVSPETSVAHHQINFDDAWDFEEVYNQLYSWAKDYPFRPEEEEYLIHITTGTHVTQICMFLLTESQHFPAKLLQSQPAGRDENVPGHYAIIDLDLSKYDKIAARLNEQQERELSALKSGIDTRNKRFNALIERIEFVSLQSSEPILLIGPTGAGKSRLAQRIYELKKEHHRITGNLVELNCATIRGDAAMSALFGHTKGSFTGALQPRKGLLLEADKGLLFLDEIGELGLDEQAMLLRALEEGSFFPVGSDKPVSSEFLLIAATNKDLSQQVREGKFREDLFARINLWEFYLPSLTERIEDIEPNIEFELDRCSRELGKRITFNAEGHKKFLSFATSSEAIWSSNFRDLAAAMSRMATLSPQGRIGSLQVEEEQSRLLRRWQETTPDKEQNTPTPTTSSGAKTLQALLSKQQLADLDAFERMQLEGVLSVCLKCDSMAEAGRWLFQASRLKRKSRNDADRVSKFLSRYGLEWKEIQRHRD